MERLEQTCTVTAPRFRLSCAGVGWQINLVPCVLVAAQKPIRVLFSDGNHIEGEAVFATANQLHRIDFGAQGVDVIYFNGVAAVNGISRRIDEAEVDCIKSASQAWEDSKARDSLKFLGIAAAPGDPQISSVMQAILRDPFARLSQQDAAQLSGLERTQMLRCFKAATGMTFRTYKKWIGLQAAVDVMLSGEQIGLAALDGGFSDAAHFSRSFKSAFGFTPTEAKKSVDAGLRNGIG